MGKELATSGGNALAPFGGVNPWAAVARGVEDGAYLKFNGNTGDLTFGSDDTELPVGSRIVVDMTSFATGWICWVESAVEEELLVAVVDGVPPQEHELPDHGPYADDDDGWRKAASFSAVLASYGDDEMDEAVGTKLLFKTSTGGPVRSALKLAGQYGRLFAQHPDEYPIVELQTESYMPKVKKHGKKWSLTFKIVGWMTEDEMAGLAGPVDDEGDYEDERPVRKANPVAKAEPAPKRRAAPAPAEDEYEEEPAPAPRRRAAAPPPEDEYEEEPAPAPRRRAAAPPPEDEYEEEPAPAPRRRAAAPPVEEEEEQPAPTPRRRAAAPPQEDEDEGDVAPTPRGRSAGRGAPPSNARIRNFD